MGEGFVRFFYTPAALLLGIDEDSGKRNVRGNHTNIKSEETLRRVGFIRMDWKAALVLTICNEAHFWLNGYVNKQNCRISSEANPHVYVETPLHPEKLTVWCALWAGGILLQKQ
ncbi:hypothetical protein TNCV_1759511 [Trichonephila clavipes]|nr:hypothetical protein TNCV_1759511 [Trichonephila clavipes]